jgi:hypothetical protein
MAEPLVRWMFHSTAMVPDYEVARDRLALLAGLRVLEYSDNPQPEIGRRGGMCWVGDNSIELGQPTVEGGGAARFVSRTGGGVHSVAVQVTSIDSAIAHVEAAGVAVAARPMPEMIFTDPRETDGVFVEWSSFEVDVDPHFGAAPPPLTVEPLVDAVHHAFVGAVVADPIATASRLAALFGQPVTFERADAVPGEPVAGVSLGDCTLALYALPGAESTALWAQDHPRARCHLVALMVAELPAAPVLDRAGFATVRRTDSMVVLDPRTTGGVQVALVDALLPGDPRA